MEAANKVMYERSPCRPIIFFSRIGYVILAVVFFVMMLIEFYRVRYTDCTEPNGVCPYSANAVTDATDGECCNFWCCSTEVGDFLANASASFLGRNCFWNHQPQDCVTEIGAGLESCGGDTCRKINQGEFRNVPSVTWPVALCVLFVLPIFYFNISNATYGCRVSEHVIAVFGDWQALGIQVLFYPGLKRPTLTFIPPVLPRQPGMLPQATMVAQQPGQMGNTQIQMGQLAQPAATQFSVTVP
jgi:hypothetical protein